MLGERESGTARLEEAVAAYRAALEELPRDRVPLDWAMTQHGLGNALSTLGERESGTKRLEEAVLAHRAALEERTRDRVPLQWAQTQNNLGSALSTLGERESGTAQLEAAVAAYRAALGSNFHGGNVPKKRSARQSPWIRRRPASTA
jgi:tetratricopeptide (TPR) repeat protein